MTNTLIAGEAMDDIARALVHMRFGEPDEDGMVEMTAEMPAEVYRPLRSALMRVEADLMAKEAEELSRNPKAVARTDGQRRHDAFAELMRRFNRAAEAERQKN